MGCENKTQDTEFISEKTNALLRECLVGLTKYHLMDRLVYLNHKACELWSVEKTESVCGKLASTLIDFLPFPYFGMYQENRWSVETHQAAVTACVETLVSYLYSNFDDLEFLGPDEIAMKFRHEYRSRSKELAPPQGPMLKDLDLPTRAHNALSRHFKWAYGLTPEQVTAQMVANLPKKELENIRHMGGKSIASIKERLKEMDCEPEW